MANTKYIWGALFAIIVIAGALMIYSAAQESTIMDELPHIPAGYSYVRFLDYRLNPEHPPLMKALSGIPLLFTNVNFPKEHKSWTEDVNGQWDLGTEFFYRRGNDANKLLFLARIPAILLTLLTILLVYLFAKEIIGKKWALLPALLFGLSPTVLAHGHYVTTDLSATFGALLAIYAFTSLLTKPTRGKMIFSGIALGVAELMKFSNVLLIPFFLLLVGFLVLSEYAENRRAGKERIAHRKWKTYLFSFVVTCLIALVLIYVVYLLFTWNEPIDIQVSDTQTILQSFSYRPAADFVTSMAGSKILRPMAQYITGVMMVLQRASGGNTGYFFGEIGNAGWHHYFPTVFFFKEPLPSLALILIALFFGLFSTFRMGERGYARKFIDYLGLHFQEFAMILFIAIYWAWSMKSNLNIGVRHLLPTLPMIYILSASALKKMFESRDRGPQGTKIMYLFSERIVGPLFRRELSTQRIKAFGLGVILVWFLIESSIASPHFISYFNEIGGGKWGGYRIATDSNYDWGQDLTRLNVWVKENGVEKIAVDYFGGGNPEYSLGASYIPWSSAKGNPADEDIAWIAVSINTLTQSMAKQVPGFTRSQEGEYTFLRERNKNFKEGMNAVPTPDVRIGTSIFLYKVK